MLPERPEISTWLAWALDGSAHLEQRRQLAPNGLFFNFELVEGVASGATAVTPVQAANAGVAVSSVVGTVAGTAVVVASGTAMIAASVGTAASSGGFLATIMMLSQLQFMHTLSFAPVRLPKSYTVFFST